MTHKPTYQCRMHKLPMTESAAALLGYSCPDCDLPLLIMAVTPAPDGYTRLTAADFAQPDYPWPQPKPLGVSE